MNNRFGKLGIFCLALIIALACTGVGYTYWSDTLTIEGTVTTDTWDVGGTIGFWKNWNKHKTFTDEEIAGWLGSVNATSKWLGPTTVEGMEGMLWQKCGGDMKCKFLKQYLATRLNVESGLLSPTATHDVSSIDQTNYLGLADAKSATLPEIIAAIESKYPLDPTALDAVWPTHDEYEIMKDICDYLNNTGVISPHLF